jgi:hypothetical protein
MASQKLDITTDSHKDFATLTYTDPGVWRQIFAFDLVTDASTKDELTAFSKLCGAAIVLAKQISGVICNSICNASVFQITPTQQTNFNLRHASVDQIRLLKYTDTNVWQQVFTVELPIGQLTQQDLINIAKYSMMIRSFATFANRYAVKILVKRKLNECKYKSDNETKG